MGYDLKDDKEEKARKLKRTAASQARVDRQKKAKSPLFGCKDCGEEISKKAEACPHCGTPVKKKAVKFGCAGVFLVLFILFTIGLISSSLNRDTKKITISKTTPASSPKNNPVKTIPELPAEPETPILKSREQFQEDSHQICLDKWTKRGEIDNRMFNHCMEGQMDGYSELLQLHQYAEQSFYAGTSFPYCQNKWTKRGISDARMMAHCLNQEVEGIKDVMYYREQYAEEKVNQIAGSALSQFHSWNMAAYKVKQHFQ